MYTNRDHKSKSARLDKERVEQQRAGSKSGGKHSKGFKPALHRLSGANPKDVVRDFEETEDEDMFGGRR